MLKHIVNKDRFKPLTPALTEGKLKTLQEIFFSNKTIEKEIALMEVISGETRLKILHLLAKETFLSVSDIAHILKSKPSGISHQLSILREYDLVKTRKKERVVLYSLTSRLPKLVVAAIS